MQLANPPRNELENINPATWVDLPERSGFRQCYLPALVVSAQTSFTTRPQEIVPAVGSLSSGTRYRREDNILLDLTRHVKDSDSWR